MNRCGSGRVRLLSYLISTRLACRLLLEGDRPNGSSADCERQVDSRQA